MEALEGIDFIDTKLRGDVNFMGSVPGGLYHLVNTGLPADVLPDDIFCVFQQLSGLDQRGGGGVKIGTVDQYVAKIIGPISNSAGIKAAFNLMDALLDNAKGTTIGATVYYLIRQQAFLLSQTVNGREALIAVAQYATFIQEI